MDKSTELIRSTPFIGSLSPSSENSIPHSRSFNISKTAKIFKTLEEAFAAFDVEEEPSKVEYLVPEVQLPPIPQQENVQNQLLQNALLLVDSGEYALSRNILGEILKKNDRCVEAIRWMGWCFKQEDKLTQAQKFYERLIELRQSDQDFFELGEIYYAQNENQKTIDAFQKSLEFCGSESPHLFDLYKGLGNAFTRIGDYESAEENYNKAHTLRSRSDALQVNFGSLAFQRQNYLQAMAHFKSALEINPFNEQAWCGVSLVAREMKDSEWARATVLKALDINSHSETAKQILEVLDNGA